jgi:hypothetical protein
MNWTKSYLKEQQRDKHTFQTVAFFNKWQFIIKIPKYFYNDTPYCHLQMQ